MKEDFVTVKQNIPGICKVSTDFYLLPKRRGVNFFVKSPATSDKTWSLCLYPNSNRFCDFANGNFSGDCISFVAYVRDCSNWEALKMLENFYGLSSGNERDRKEIQRRIQLQRQQERKEAERKTAFKTALSEVAGLFTKKLTPRRFGNK